MTEIEWVPLLKGKLRKDEPGQLGETTWSLLRVAIREGRRDDAVELADYLRSWGTAFKPHAPGLELYVWGYLTFIAMKHGEDHVPRALHYWRNILVGAGDPYQYMSPAELVEGEAALQSATCCGPNGEGILSVVEGADRYVMTLDPCGTGGRAWRAVDAKRGPFGLTSKAYPWSWGRAGVPYYCASCCVWWEIMPIQSRGYPARVTECPQRCGDPCHILFYKRPEAIPERFFARVGAVKDISRLSR